MAISKTILSISIILSIIYLLYVILDFTGIIRYLKMYQSSKETYIKEYEKLDRGKKDKVVITVISSLKDYNRLNVVLKSLLDQTVKVDNIYLTSLKYKELPNDIKKLTEMYVVEKDYGSYECNAVIPILKKEMDNNTTIIVVGDDKIYGKNFIEELLNKSNDNPNCVIQTGSGKINLKNGCLLKNDMFNSNFFDKTPTVDFDNWLNDNIDKKIVKNSYFWNYDIIDGKTISSKLCWNICMGILSKYVLTYLIL